METNRGSLLEVAVIGEITHPVVEGLYMTDWEGRPLIGVGRGGIVYNVKVGDPCFGWAWGEKVEPGASADGLGEERERGAFRNLSCIGNEAKITDGEAKGDNGIVVGKVGYMPDRGHHLVIHFEDLEKVAIGDKVMVRAFGAGLKIKGFEDVKVNKCSPRLLESMGVEVEDDKLVVPVVKEIPPFLMGSGIGFEPLTEPIDYDIQTTDPKTVEKYGLKSLRLGDVVALKDQLCIHGRGYYRGATTVGVIVHGASDYAGHGPGVNPILSAKEGRIKTRIDPNANIAYYLNLKEPPE